ncbi:MAG: AAA family ATPase [Synechococcales cyanobacterium RM1_1_8]|nr:AAA family ATPase [Synechococcales cyanobacterium RM1_1_8]
MRSFSIRRQLYGRDRQVAQLLESFDRAMSFAGDGGARMGLAATNVGTNISTNISTNIVRTAVTSTVAGTVSQRQGHALALADPALLGIITAPPGQLLLISGPSGMGKSRLVAELHRPITARQGHLISGKFDQLQRKLPYAALVDALAGLIDQLLGEPEIKLRFLARSLQAALGQNAGAIAALLPNLSLILGDLPPLSQLDNQASQQRFHHSFRQFIQALSPAEHPLALFLDNLQWADSASLQLLEVLLSQGQIPNLFVLGAYRDNEVEPGHPLQQWITQLGEAQVQVEQLPLGPCSSDAVVELLADSLKVAPAEVVPLAQLITAKTGGNPYFINELLKQLYQNNWLNFDRDRQCWTWELEPIRQLHITDNVVELMLQQLQQLPEVSRASLCQAACFGPRFSISVLAQIQGCSLQDCYQRLKPALKAGLVQAEARSQDVEVMRWFRFEHGRIQQAAYSLISPGDRSKFHLAIARQLLQQSQASALESRHPIGAAEAVEPEQGFISKGDCAEQNGSGETNRSVIPGASPRQSCKECGLGGDRSFELIDHFNRGSAGLTDPIERRCVAQLNLQAARQARQAMAYSALVEYAEAGLALLLEDAWEQDYGLTLELHSLAALGGAIAKPITSTRC